jgi:citron Rho-interacting kinase
MYEECRRQNDSLTFQKRELEQDKRKLAEDVLRLQEQLRKRDDSLDKLRLANTKLKAACIEQERQLETYQSMYDGKVDETQQILAENATRAVKEQQAQTQINNLHNKISELVQSCDEIGMRATAEREHLQKQLELQRERIQLLEHALEDESQSSTQYAREVSGLQNETVGREQQVKTLMNELDKAQRELTLIKEEATRHITSISSLKSQNQTLTKMYDDMKKKYELAKTRICALLEESDLKDSNFEYDKLRLQETINQQTKLIDYLQTLSEKPTKKHLWFNSNDNKTIKSPLLPNTGDKKATNHVREIESALERERTKNKVLLEQYNQTNIELLECKKERESR